MNDDTILRLESVSKHFTVGGQFFRRARAAIHAVDNVSLDIARGTTMALVGESGCGKTTLARTVAGVYPVTSGHILVEGADISIPSVLRSRRRSIQLVSQNPLSSLNRRRSVQHALEQPLRVHKLASSSSERLDVVSQLLVDVGLSPDYLRRYPVEMSVGELQRVTVARALSVRPSILILDEPTASLDMTMKGRLLNLLSDVQSQIGLTYLLITHEIDIAAHASDMIAVMYLGRVVEVGPTDEVVSDPKHPYTQSLLASVLRVEQGRVAPPKPLAGEVPSSIDRPTGCAFHPRCPISVAECASRAPELRVIEAAHAAACHLAK